VARDRYGIAPEVEAALGGHPFLFRVAHDLGLGAIAPSVGRYRLLDGFIDRHLDQAAARLGIARATARARLRTLAGALPAAGTGSLAREEAERILGGYDVLDAVASVSVLRLTETDRVGFTYDQVAEALRPVPEDLDALFPKPRSDGALPASAIREGVAALLRLEADDREEDFRRGLDLLLARLEELRARDEKTSFFFRRDFELLCEAAVHLTDALPRAREREVEEVYRFLAGCPQLFVDLRSLGRLARWLADAPSSAATRAALLLDIAPWSNAWPWRWKDWSDPSRRNAFVGRLEDTHGGDYDSNLVVPLLHRLLADAPAEVRPVILGGLGNWTRIEHGKSDDSRGEATISSLCAGLLFHRRGDDLPGLLDALLTRSGDAASLAAGIAAEDPVAAAHAVARLVDPERTLGAAEALRAASGRLSDELRALAVEALVPSLEPSSGAVAYSVAAALLALDPVNTAAWDAVARTVSPSEQWRASTLLPIPGARAKQAVEMAKRLGGDIAHTILRALDGPEVDQGELAAVADELCRGGEMRGYLFGSIIESKLHWLGSDARYKPWAELARRVAKDGPDDARVCLIHAAFGCPEPHPSVEAVRRALLAAKLSPDNISLVVEKLYAWAVPTKVWLPLFAEVRRSDPEAADFEALFSLRLDGYHSDRRWEAALAVLDYWRSLPEAERSDLSRDSVTLADAGSGLDEIFSFEG
jgi:hypothetical protein